MGKAGRPGSCIEDASANQTTRNVEAGSGIKKSERRDGVHARKTADTQLIQQLRKHHMYTAQHSVRVHDIAQAVCKELKLAAPAANHVCRVALLHDVGKVVVPVSLLDGSGRPTDEEFAQLKEHSNAGDQMLKGARIDRKVCAAVRAIHERLDGGGYPDGLKGEEIPLAARMIAVCDAFDAISAPGRNYQQTRSAQDALQILEGDPGHFDARIVAALRAVVEQ